MWQVSETAHQHDALHTNRRLSTRCCCLAHQELMMSEQIRRTRTNHHGDDGEYPKKNDEEGCHSRCNKANPKGPRQQRQDNQEDKEDDKYDIAPLCLPRQALSFIIPLDVAKSLHTNWSNHQMSIISSTHVRNVQPYFFCQECHKPVHVAASATSAHRLASHQEELLHFVS